MSKESAHTYCMAHSGLTFKATINIILSGIALLLLSYQLNVSMDIRGAVIANAKDINELTQRLDRLEDRILTVERVK